MNQLTFARVMPWLIGTFGLIFAFIVGRMAGQSDTRNLTIIFGGLFIVTVCLMMRTTIWLLIPFAWSLTGRISVLPLPFSVRDLSIMLVGVMFAVFYALKMVRFKSSSGWLEILVFLNIAYIASMYLRHPVGAQAFGSVLVGGRPYFNAIIGILAFLILRIVIISPRQANVFPFLLLAGSLLVSGLGLLTKLIPGLVPVIAPLYSGLSVSNYLASQGYQDQAVEGSRYTEVAGSSQTVVQILGSYFRPISLLLPSNPLRLTLSMAAGLGILMAGYRSGILSSVLFLLVASYFHGGTRDVLRVATIGLVVLFLAIVLQLSVGLPLQAQRALSFIPLVPWNQVEKDDAESSTQWRLDMWKMVLNEQKYLKDKIWGDGFGFSAYELQIMQAEAFGGGGFEGAAVQESFMINGTFHSGPLSTIRYAGVVGLILFLSLLFYLAFQAPRLIENARGTPYFSTAVFVAVPLVYSGFFFIFIFGSYDGGVPDTLFTAGLFRLIQNSLEKYKKIEVPEPPSAPGFGRSVISGRQKSKLLQRHAGAKV